MGPYGGERPVPLYAWGWHGGRISGDKKGPASKDTNTLTGGLMKSCSDWRSGWMWCVGL